MRGKIIAYNDFEGRGIISGDDGHRYGFVRGSLGSSPALARPGQDVDYEANGDQAANIYVIGGAVAVPVGGKSKVAAGLLAIFLGGFGIHKFYLGCTGAGIIMVLVWLFGFILIGIPTAIISVIAFVEGIIYLTKTDEGFYQTYEAGKKCWF